MFPGCTKQGDRYGPCPKEINQRDSLSELRLQINSSVRVLNLLSKPRRLVKPRHNILAPLDYSSSTKTLPPKTRTVDSTRVRKRHRGSRTGQNNFNYFERAIAAIEFIPPHPVMLAVVFEQEGMHEQDKSRSRIIKQLQRGAENGVCKRN